MIKAIITDFDGTLVDTFDANLKAYQEAFYPFGINLSPDGYRECFGLRFDDFMSAMGIKDNSIAVKIREYKKKVYPKYFDRLIPNKNLIDLIYSFHKMGGRTAIASTASQENLFNALNYIKMTDSFDLIYSAKDVKQGKPSPEIYIKAMNKLDVNPNNVLIFEDSLVGIEAAKSCGAKYITVTKEWFNR